MMVCNQGGRGKGRGEEDEVTSRRDAVSGLDLKPGRLLRHNSHDRVPNYPPNSFPTWGALTPGTGPPKPSVRVHVLLGNPGPGILKLPTTLPPDRHWTSFVRPRRQRKN
jgi:hypothetical protein